MKKSEVNQLMELIECLVSRELKKQLPSIINEVKGSLIKESASPSKPTPSSNEELDLKTSLREMFAAGNVPKKTEVVVEQKKYVKDPILNQLLNETRPDIRSRDVGMSPIAAFIEQYKSPSIQIQPTAGAGEMMASEEMPFMKNMPTMQPVAPPAPARELTQPVVSNAPIELPEGVSAMDVAPMIDPVLGKILNRNYSDKLKAMDKAAKALRPM